MRKRVTLDEVFAEFPDFKALCQQLMQDGYRTHSLRRAMRENGTSTVRLVLRRSENRICFTMRKRWIRKAA